MRIILCVLMALMLTSCTGLSVLQTSAINHVIEAVSERKLNETLTPAERPEEGGELSDPSVL